MLFPRVGFSLLVVFSLLLLVASTGCNFFGMGSDPETLSSVLDRPSTTGSANVQFNVVIPNTQPHGGNILPTIRSAGRSQATVRLRLIIVNAGNETNPTTVLTKNVAVEDDGTAQAVFSGVPAKTTVCQMKIDNGNLGGKTDFHGAADLSSGDNQVTITPVGCGDPNDVLAQVIVSVVVNPELVKTAPPDLAAKVRAAAEFVLAGGTLGAGSYQETMDRIVTTNTFTGLEFTPVAIHYDGTLRQGTDGGWRKTPAEFWDGVNGASDLQPLRVVRQGLGTYKPPLVTFTDSSKQRFALALVDPSSGARKEYLLSDGSSLRNLSAVAIRPSDQAVVFGATANGVPVLLRWSGTDSDTIGWPPNSTQVPWFGIFPGLASSTNLANPEVEYLDVDAGEAGVLNAVVRDPATMILREFRVLANGTIEPRQQFATATDTSAVSWPLVAVSADKTVTLSWDRVPNADSYNLYWSFDPNVETNASVSTKITGVTSPYTHTELTNGLPYFYRMTWVIGDQEYGPSRVAAGMPKDSTIPIATFTANVNGVWAFRLVNEQGEFIDSDPQASMTVILRQEPGSNVVTQDPTQFDDDGRTWVQTVTQGRIVGNQLSWTDVRIAEGRMGYRTQWNAVVGDGTLSGWGEDIMGSSFGGHLTPGDEEGAEHNDRWYYVATRTSTIAPPPPAPASATYFLSSLNGAWVATGRADEFNFLTFVTDGNGRILDMGDDGWATGSYTLRSDNSFLLSTVIYDLEESMDVRCVVKLDGPNTGTFQRTYWEEDVSFPAAPMERVTNPAACQGIWTGQLTINTLVGRNSTVGTVATFSTDVTFVVGMDGMMTSISGAGISGFRSGSFLVGPSGKGKAAFRTNTNPHALPWKDFSVQGELIGNEFRGLLMTAASDDPYFKTTVPCVLRRLPAGSRVPTVADLVGSWGMLRALQPDGKIDEYLASPQGNRTSYTIAANGQAVLQNYPSQAAGDAQQFVDQPDAPKNSSWVLEGSTIVETHADRVVCRYQPVLLSDGNLQLLKLAAPLDHDDVGTTYIWERKVTSAPAFLSASALVGFWKATVTDPGAQAGDTWDILFRVSETGGRVGVEFVDGSNWASNPSYSNGVLSFRRTMDSGLGFSYDETWSIPAESATRMRAGVLDSNGKHGSWIADRVSAPSPVSKQELTATWDIIEAKAVGQPAEAFSANTAGQMSNITFAANDLMTGTLYQIGTRPAVGHLTPYLTAVVEEGPLDYRWSLTGDELQFGDPAPETHVERWRVTALPQPDGRSILKLELLSDNDDQSRKGEVMFIRKHTGMTPHVESQRFSGSYRFFSYGAYAPARWLTVSDITVNGTSLTWQDVLDSNGHLDNFGGTISESDGLVTIDSEHRAAVSPSGNYIAIHNFSTDPYIGIGVKLPTNATNALLNGDYRIYCINETVDNGGGNPRSPKFTIDVVHFDGAGNGVGVGQILNEEGGGPVPELTYSIAPDGRMTSNSTGDNCFRQVSADGNVIISAEYDGGEREFFIGVRIGSGMSTADLPSRCVVMTHWSGWSNPYSSSVSSLGTIGSDGSSTLTDAISEHGLLDNEQQGRFTISADGTYGSSSTMSWGSLSPDKEFLVLPDIDDEGHYFSFAVKR